MKPLSIVKGVDCFSTISPGWAPQLKALGYGFAARYYRRAPLTGGKGNAVSREEVAALHANGLAFLPVYQNTSDKPEYFTVVNAHFDGMAAAAKARDMGQPHETAIYFAVDCDPSPDQIEGVLDYFAAAGGELHEWRISVYGPGHVCEALSEANLVWHTWLSNAKGWRGYKEWLPKADVVQTTLPFDLPFGLNVDGNEARNDAGMWFPVTQKPLPGTRPWWRFW